MIELCFMPFNLVITPVVDNGEFSHCILMVTLNVYESVSVWVDCDLRLFLGSFMGFGVGFMSVRVSQGVLWGFGVSLIGTVYRNYHHPALIIIFIFPDLLPKILQISSPGARMSYTDLCVPSQALQ